MPRAKIGAATILPHTAAAVPLILETPSVLFKINSLVALPSTKKSGDICWIAMLLEDVLLNSKKDGAVKVRYFELDYDADPTVYYLEDTSGWVKVAASKIICALPSTMKIAVTPSSTILEYVSSKLEARLLPSRTYT